jgi:hypothetical protein
VLALAAKRAVEQLFPAGGLFIGHILKVKVIFWWILPVNQESVTFENNNLAMLDGCENTTIQLPAPVRLYA